MRSTILAGLAGAALLINCGGDYCSNMETFENNASTRNGACNNGFTVVQTFSQSSCENVLSNECTSSDQSELAKASSCLNGLPQCTPGTQTTFNGEVESCDGDAQSVTTSCNLALAAAGVPIISLGSVTGCTASGGACSKDSDCCSGTCNTTTCG